MKTDNKKTVQDKLLELTIKTIKESFIAGYNASENGIELNSALSEYGALIKSTLQKVRV